MLCDNIVKAKKGKVDLSLKL